MFAAANNGSVIVRSTEPSRPEKTTTAPWLVAPTSSPGAPAATSRTPSPSTSSSARTDEPRLSLDEPVLILRISEPSAPEKTATLPTSLPRRLSSKTTPAAMSGTPSKLTSPIPATEVPSQSLWRPSGSVNLYTGKALAPLNTTTLPVSTPSEVSSNRTPARTSGTPSPVMSGTQLTE